MLKNLHWWNAIKTENAEEIWTLLTDEDSPALLEMMDSRGETGLSLLAQNGSVQTANLLISLGADINHKQNHGWTPLMNASFAGNFEIAKALILAGADVNDQSYNKGTALIYASQKGNKDIVELLLQSGADHSIKDRYGKTALMRASANGCTEAVRTLLEAGADVLTTDLTGRTALIYAECFTNTSLALLKANANVNDLFYYQNNVTEMLKDPEIAKEVQRRQHELLPELFEIWKKYRLRTLFR